MNPTHLVRAKLVGGVPMRELGERFADPLYHALQAHNFGDITGGNGHQNEDGAMEWISIDIRLVDLDEALTFTRRTLAELGAPPGSELEYTVDGKTHVLPITDAPRRPESMSRADPAPHDPIALALAEDIGPGDVTVEFFIDPAQTAAARIFAREPAVVAGAPVAAEVFARVDPALTVTVERADGSSLASGETVLTVHGRAGSILTAERVALNFLQRLSGVATLTRQFVDAVAGTRARILDTRKTTPGLRTLEKAAVLAGGGTNHRMGLYDMVMVKDNHLLADGAASALQAAITRARATRTGLRIELEADTLAQVRTFLSLDGVDVILLDNMSLDDLRAAVALGEGHPVQFEASGGINLATVRAIAETGVQWISVGAITHSARAIDFSLEFLPS